MTAGKMNWGRMEMTDRPISRGRAKLPAHKLDWERLVNEHPQLSWLVLLVGAPCGLLAGVVGIVGTVMLPLSLLFGWPIV